MKRITLYSLMTLCAVCLTGIRQYVSAQGMHFSQFYNAPLLLNPANAGLMSEKDFRVGVNYRDQWKKLPAPYKTMSAFGDFQLFRNMNSTNWLGVGLAVFNDKAGDGELTLTRFEGALSYHIMMGEFSMISVGLSGGYGQRSVNYNKLSFNDQWDGFRFDYTRSNNEMDGIIKTTYFDVGAGLNYAYFPNEYTYIKIGLGLAHVNQPYESFYKQKINQLGMRPTANVDILLRMNETFTLNPSAYYTTQSGAYEALLGTLGMIYVGGEEESASSLILGAFYRWNEAVVPVAGMQFGGVKIMASFDFTISTLSADNKGVGAFELGINYQGIYGDMSRGRRTINCPRF